MEWRRYGKWGAHTLPSISDEPGRPGRTNKFDIFFSWNALAFLFKKKSYFRATGQPRSQLYLRRCILHGKMPWMHRDISETPQYIDIYLSHYRRVRRGGVHWVHVHHPPPPTWKKVPLRNVEKGKESSTQICRQKIMHVLLRYDKIKTKKVGKKEEKISKRKGIKERG